MKRTITHKEFVESYKKGELFVSVDKWRAGDFVLSELASKYNKPAYLFWSLLGIILAVPLAIIFLFINWFYSIISFFLGILIIGATRKSACQFVLQNMLDDEFFWGYIITNKGAIIRDKSGDEYTPVV